MSALRAVTLTGSLLGLAAFTPTSALAGTCDPITERGKQINQEQLAFTLQAYSDGKITPEEAAQAEAYSQAIAQTTADLQKCIETGVLPPGYDTTPPTETHFELGHKTWRVGDRALRISWSTSEASSAEISFELLGKGGKKRTVGTLRAPAGQTSILFKGKVAKPGLQFVGYKLRPGRYQLNLTAADASGNISTTPISANLKILDAALRQRH